MLLLILGIMVIVFAILYPRHARLIIKSGVMLGLYSIVLIALWNTLGWFLVLFIVALSVFAFLCEKKKPEFYQKWIEPMLESNKKENKNEN